MKLERVNFLLQLKNSSENSLKTFQNNFRHSNSPKILVRSKPAGHQSSQVSTTCRNVSRHIDKGQHDNVAISSRANDPFNTKVTPCYLEQTIQFYAPSLPLSISKQT